MAAEENEPQFRVTDRRGRAREEEANPPPASPPLTDAERQRPSAGPSPRSSPTAPAPPGLGAGTSERNLAGLFVMLATSALTALGETPDPTTGQRHRAPEQAAELIDLLMLLREKTEGNRTPQETTLLDEVLYDLHMRYTQLMTSSGSRSGPARS